MYSFIVSTYNHLSEEEKENIMDKHISMFDDKMFNYMIVKEYGESGNNPHLNFIIECTKNQHDQFIKQLKSFYNNNLNKYTVKGKRIMSQIQLMNVVGGYLQKEEESHIVVQTPGWIDLPKAKQEAQIGLAKTQRKSKFINKYQCAEIIFDYFETKIQELGSIKMDWTDAHSHFIVITKHIAQEYIIMDCIKHLNSIWQSLQLRYKIYTPENKQILFNKICFNEY